MINRYLKYMSAFITWVILLQCSRNQVPQGLPYTTEYYQQFDLIHLSPFQKSAHKPSPPYVKVFNDESGLDSLEIYLAHRRKVSQTLKRIKSEKSEKIYAGYGYRYPCTTVDTLVSVRDELFEFRSCYARNSTLVNEQLIIVYRKLSEDTVWVAMFYLNPSTFSNKNPVPVSTSIDTIKKLSAVFGKGSVEEFYIINKNGEVNIQCNSFNTPACENGADRSWFYAFRGSLYWSLVLNEYWELMEK